MKERAGPAVKRKRRAAEKPPMPGFLEPIAAVAKERHRRRHANPGVVVEVEKVGSHAYVLSSPHRDTDSWQAMVCDALGTRSDSTAQAFLLQLTELCQQHWHPSEGEEPGRGEWVPDERELNMVLNLATSIKPRNEMEAALGAQMVAVHLMAIRVSARALGDGYVVADDAAIAGKLARTFVMQMDALSRLKGKRSTSKQTITVRQEKHVHHHQHVHVDPGSGHLPGQCHETRAAGEPAERPALPCPQPGGEVLRFPGGEGEEGLPLPRRDKPRSAQG